MYAETKPKTESPANGSKVLNPSLVNQLNTISHITGSNILVVSPFIAINCQFFECGSSPHLDSVFCLTCALSLILIIHFFFLSCHPFDAELRIEKGGTINQSSNFFSSTILFPNKLTCTMLFSGCWSFIFGTFIVVCVKMLVVQNTCRTLWISPACHLPIRACP